MTNKERHKFGQTMRKSNFPAGKIDTDRFYELFNLMFFNVLIICFLVAAWNSHVDIIISVGAF